MFASMCKIVSNYTFCRDSNGRFMTKFAWKQCCSPILIHIMLFWWLNTVVIKTTFEPPRDKTNKMACAPSEDSDHLFGCPG